MERKSADENHLSTDNYEWFVNDLADKIGTDYNCRSTNRLLDQIPLLYFGFEVKESKSVVSINVDKSKIAKDQEIHIKYLINCLYGEGHKLRDHSGHCVMTKIGNFTKIEVSNKFYDDGDDLILNKIEIFSRADLYSTEEDRTETLKLESFSNLEKLLETGEFADVKFLIDGEIVMAHKNILSCHSDFFRHFLDQNQEYPDGFVTVEINDVPYAMFKETLKFMYSGSNCDYVKSKAAEFLPIAVSYNLPQLKYMCVEALYRQLNRSNVVEYLKLAILYKIEFLKNAALKLIQEIFKEDFTAENISNYLANDDGLNCLADLFKKMFQTA